MNKPLAAATTSAAFGLAAVLTLTACGGSDDSASDKITDTPSTSAPATTPPTSAPATTEAPAGAPEIKLPADVHVEITDPSATGEDAATKKAVGDLKYAITALLDGTAQGRGDVPSMTYSYTGSAGAYWSQRITAVRKAGQTITGTYRYYRLDAQASGAGMLSHYCEDQSKAFGKDLKTNKVKRNVPSEKSYLYYTVNLIKDAGGTWQVAQVNWTKGAKECLNG